MNDKNHQIVETEWVSFPGGELEGKRPKALCSACRKGGHASHTLCFQCYRREHILKASGQLDTASPERFQVALPFEPINRPRLAALKAEHVAARATLRQGAAKFEQRRRQAQIGARRALQRIDAALEARTVEPAMRERIMVSRASAVHAAELQLPESWLAFVVGR